MGECCLRLTELDRSILKGLRNATFDDQILVKLASELSIQPSVVIQRLSELKERGLIRRWGVHINSHALGYRSALIALAAKDAQIKSIREWVEQEEGVSHCYTRVLKDQSGKLSNHRLSTFNVWLTLASINHEVFDQKIVELKESIGLDDSSVLLLPTQQKFKLRFDIVPE